MKSNVFLEAVSKFDTKGLTIEAIKINNVSVGSAFFNLTRHDICMKSEQCTMNGNNLTL